MSFGVRCSWLMVTALLCLGDVAHAQQTGVSPGQTGFGNQPTEVERPPDPARGERLFRTCLKCHAIIPGEIKIGPSLAGVVGRQPGSLPDFGYSQDMIDFGTTGRVWDEQVLDRFLTKPRAMIAGTKMVFQGFRKPSDRTDLIAYLSTIRG